MIPTLIDLMNDVISLIGKCLMSKMDIERPIGNDWL